MCSKIWSVLEKQLVRLFKYWRRSKMWRERKEEKERRSKGICVSMLCLIRSAFFLTDKTSSTYFWEEWNGSRIVRERGEEENEASHLIILLFIHTTEWLCQWYNSGVVVSSLSKDENWDICPIHNILRINCRQKWIRCG